VEVQVEMVAIGVQLRDWERAIACGHAKLDRILAAVQKEPRMLNERNQ
jgi:hypothetical protein